MKLFGFIQAKRFISAKDSILSRDSKITRVRIWRSGYFDSNNNFVHTNVVTSFLSSFKLGRQSNIGHVSIETKDLYASLWPEGIDIFNKLKPQDSNSESSSPTKDEGAEGRPADHLVDFETLDVDAIKQALDNYIKLGPKYHLIGRNRFFKELNANSCSGLGYDLLKQGGIDKLIMNRHFLRDFIVTTPHNLADLVIAAKIKENEILNQSNPMSGNY
ncbi:MAG: hypothetical protein ACK4PR_05765 [Gammaproteobacteria bacterium]